MSPGPERRRGSSTPQHADDAANESRRVARTAAEFRSGRGGARRPYRPSIGVLALLASVGCGGRTLWEDVPQGEVSAVECSAVNACGGEIAGEWEVIGGCTDLSFVRDSLLGCPEAELVESKSRVMGRAEFSREGTYFLELSYGGSVAVAIPNRCVGSGVAPDRCSDLAADLARRGALLLDSSRCFPNESGCFCHLEQQPYERSGSGTYTTRAGVISDPKGKQQEYCVEQDRLWLSVGDSLEGETIAFSRAR